MAISRDSDARGIPAWPRSRGSVSWNAGARYYVFQLETMIGKNLIYANRIVGLERFAQILKGVGNDYAAAMDEIFEEEVRPRLVEKVEKFIHPPERSAVRKALDDQSPHQWEDVSYFPKLGAGDPVAEWVDGGLPPDVDFLDLPYPPPDRYRVYRPEEPLKSAIQTRLNEIHGGTVDWWLLEVEEETGYSEYTMESSYGYTVNGYDKTNFQISHEFNDLGAMIRWIEGEK